MTEINNFYCGLYGLFTRNGKYPPHILMFISAFAHLLVWIFTFYYLHGWDLHTYPLTIFFYDFVNIYKWGIFVPMIWYYFIWVPDSIIPVIEKLYKQGILKNRNNKQKLSQKISNIFLDKRITVLSLIISIIFCIYQSFAKTSSGIIIPWFDTQGAMILSQIIMGINLFIICEFVLSMVCISCVIRNYFKNNSIEHVYLYHPSGAGGLGDLGRIILKWLLFAVIAFLFIFSFTVFPNIYDPRNWPPPTIPIMYIVYFILAPLIFITTILPIHKKMKEFKDKELLKISNELLKFHISLVNNLQEYYTYNNKYEEINNLKKLYQLTKEMPEWPFSAPAIGSISVLYYIAPVLVNVLDLSNKILELQNAHF